jgi:flagellar motility protein MotE (MotC chaperone)
MKKLLTSGWVIPIVGSLLYLGTTFVLLDPASLKVPARTGAGQAADPQPSPLASTPWDFSAPELDQLVAELKAEKARLAAWNQELQEYAARIAVERAELAAVTQEVHRLQTEFNQVVTYVTQQEGEILRRQARVFAAMTPDDAVRVLQEMPDDRIIRLLMFMSEEEMAKLLAALAKPGPENAKRTALLSERLRLSVEAPPAGRKTSAAQPKGAAAAPFQALAGINGSAQPGAPADFRKLARSYAVMPAAQSVGILKQLQDEQMAAVLAEFTEEETTSFLVELSKPGQGGPQRVARVQALLLQKLSAGNT